jgi:hypothetical protein
MPGKDFGSGELRPDCRVGIFLRTSPTASRMAWPKPHLSPRFIILRATSWKTDSSVLEAGEPKGDLNLGDLEVDSFRICWDVDVRSAVSLIRRGARPEYFRMSWCPVSVEQLALSKIASSTKDFGGCMVDREGYRNSKVNASFAFATRTDKM